MPYSSTITKTIYDPCPYGYRVPKDGSWNGFPAKTWTQYAITGGTSWPAKDGGWWPAAGFRYFSSSILVYIGNYAYCWSSSRFSNAYQAYYLYFNYNGGVYPSYNAYRSLGLSVRCIEREENKQSRFLGYKHHLKQLRLTL